MKKKNHAPSLLSSRSDTYTIAYILTILGSLYWFCYFMAPTSPFYIFFQSLVKMAFGIIGTHVVFALMIVTGVMMIMSKISSNRWMIKGLVLMTIVSALLNFPLIDTFDAKQIQASGGYASWPILQILKIILGNNPFAIKVFILIISLIGVVVLSKKRLQGNQGGLLSIRSQHTPTSSSRQAKNKSTSIKNNNTAIGFSLGSFLGWFKNNPKPTISTKDFATSSVSSVSVDRIKTSDTISPTIKTQKGNLIDIPTLTGHIIDRIKEKTHTHISSNMTISGDKISTNFAIHQSQPRFNLTKPTFPLDILDVVSGQSREYDTNDIVHKAQLIVEKLKEFDIAIDFVSCDMGPSIVQLRFQPQAGVKLSKIESYKDDIQYAIKVKTLRIVAPIPGTDTIGIQIPNPHPRMVKLSEVLGSPYFASESSKSQTHLSIGIDVENTTIIKTLESMPHLLVAGATGSGKSVGVNDFIISLLYQNTPAELKFIMIDPKQVELEMYDGLPYLLAPVITTPDKALKALKWSVDEMESRYSKLKSVKLKHLSEYNQAYPHDSMTRIVIIIDELADLMLSGNKKEIETHIVRIAQKARAVGMHLITATQRPSVNVITGLIKANIPTRIAFGVAQLVDSRTILDQKGAENLVGKGDLLYLDSNIRHPLRIQAPFVSTEEISRVVSYLKSKIITSAFTESDFYNTELISLLESKGGISHGSNLGGDLTDDDEILIEQAINIITTEKKASTTLLQRKLSIGFARAGRLMDMLEQRGVVGPQDGAKPRSILI